MNRERRAPSGTRRMLAPGVPDFGRHADDAPIPGVLILPLRLFLGVTFLYAGIQKLSDPGFLRPGSPTYIGSQLLSFSRGSPIAFFLHRFMEHAVAIGLFTVVTELAIGAAVLVGFFTRPAAFTGFVLNVTFFLSASWHVYPYFLGADVPFAMAWLTLMLTGPGPLSLEAYARRLTGRYLPPPLRRLVLGPHRANTSPTWSSSRDGKPLPATGNGTSEPALLSRAETLLGGLVALVLVALGLLPRGSSSGALAGTGKRAGGKSASPGRGGGFSRPPGSRKIGNTRQLPVNSAGVVNDPKTGDPAIVIHTSGGQYYAYDAVCTHAGCTVEYDPQNKVISCPCHGATFDPSHGAQVLAGPAPSPLAALTMKIGPNGDMYLV